MGAGGEQPLLLRRKNCPIAEQIHHSEEAVSSPSPEVYKQEQKLEELPGPPPPSCENPTQHPLPCGALRAAPSCSWAVTQSGRAQRGIFLSSSALSTTQ